MALTAKIDMTVTPATLTVTAAAADRAVSVTVTSGGQTATAKGTWPVAVVDDGGHVWTLKTDDHVTAVFTY